LRFRSYLGSSPMQRALFRKTGQSLTGGTAFEADATALKRPFSSIEAHVAVARHWTKLSVFADKSRCPMETAKIQAFANCEIRMATRWRCSVPVNPNPLALSKMPATEWPMRSVKVFRHPVAKGGKKPELAIVQLPRLTPDTRLPSHSFALLLAHFQQSENRVPSQGQGEENPTTRGPESRK